MSFDAASIPIVHLAWARLLGCPDDALVPGAGRLEIPDEDAETLTFVRVFGASALRGPRWALDAARDLADDELARHATLLRLTRGHGGHGLGAAVLYFADDLELTQPEHEVTVSLDREDSAALEALCPPDDVNEVRLSGQEHQFVLLEDDRPAAGAGYEERAGILAQLGTLVAPGLRRTGRGTLIASIAGHEALSAGLVPQWRAEVNNTASRATARRLGFAEGGSQTSVLLG